MFGYRFILIDKKLFVRKLVMLLGFSAGIIPLLLYKNYFGAALYVILLLLLHLYFLVVYLWRVRWKELLNNKLGFVIRAAAILFFTYLLSLLRSGEEIASVIVFLCISVSIHIALLLLLMVRVERPSLAYEPRKSDDHEN